MASSFLSFSLLFITVHTADGFLNARVARCVFNSTDLDDIRYVDSYYFNKVEFLRFDSSVGRYVGYTEIGVKNAQRVNNNTAMLDAERADRERYCHHNVQRWYNSSLSKSVKPYVRLHSPTPPAGNHPAMLVCSVYDFYPKQIRVSWIRDGQEVTSGVTSTEEMADGDWYYQTHSYLEYTPRSGEKISCVVEHASLKQPLVTDWDPSMPESQRNQIAIGVSGLILGLISFLAGFISPHHRGRIVVPTD